MKTLLTKIFIASSISFGVIGIFLVLAGIDGGNFTEFLFNALAVNGFVVLASFGSAVGSHLLEQK